MKVQRPELLAASVPPLHPSHAIKLPSIKRGKLGRCEIIFLRDWWAFSAMPPVHRIKALTMQSMLAINGFCAPKSGIFAVHPGAEFASLIA